MKILLGHCFYRSSAPSGEDIVYKSEKKLLEDNGVEVIAYEKNNDDINDSGVMNRINLALATAWSSKSYRELVSILKRVRPDIAHFHNTFPQMSPSVYQACVDCGVPVVQTLHNYRFLCPNAMLMRNGVPCEICLDNHVIPFSALKYKCYRDSLLATSALVWMTTRNRLNNSFNNNVSYYIALSEFAKGRLIKGGLPANKIVVKPNFMECPSNPPVVKGDYAIFVGRLKEEKGVETLVKAWKEVSNKSLKIVGDGPLMAKIGKMINESHLNIELLGLKPREEVLRLISEARFLIIPSECYEGFPVTVLEAFSNSTPVLASNIGSLGEIIAHGHNGLLFNVRDSVHLSSQIIRMFDDDKMLANLGANAYREFVAKYTPKKSFDNLMAIYRSIIM